MQMLQTTAAYPVYRRRPVRTKVLRSMSPVQVKLLVFFLRLRYRRTLARPMPSRRNFTIAGSASRLKRA